MSDLSHN